MKVYLNYRGYTFILTQEVLEAMGRPRYVSFMVNYGNNEVMLIPLRNSRADIGGVRIPESVYKNCGSYAVHTHGDFLERMYYLCDVSGESTYEIEAQPRLIDKLTIGQEYGLDKKLRLTGIPVVLNMTTAKASEMTDHPVYTFGGNRVP